MQRIWYATPVKGSSNPPKRVTTQKVENHCSTLLSLAPLGTSSQLGFPICETGKQIQTSLIGLLPQIQQVLSHAWWLTNTQQTA